MVSIEKEINPNPDFIFNQEKFILKESEWFTPNTYNSNYRPAPASCGVYLIVGVNFNYQLNSEIIYVGSSKNLKIRKSTHEVIRDNCQYFDHINFYFQECESYYKREMELIKLLQPRLNKRGK